MSDLSLIYLNITLRPENFDFFLLYFGKYWMAQSKLNLIKAYPGYYEAALKTKSEESQMHGLKRAML